MFLTYGYDTVQIQTDWNAMNKNLFTRTFYSHDSPTETVYAHIKVSGDQWPNGDFRELFCCE